MYPISKLCILLLSLATVTSGFTSTKQVQLRRKTQRNLFFFGILDSGKNEGKDKDSSKKNDKKSPSNMSTTASTMESFKKSQELGKKTAALLQDLSSAVVEGTSAKGKVKVLVDGQQLPIGVEIDEEYYQNVLLDDLTEDLTTAMQDAHEKSTKMMTDKMQSLYKELGLPPTVAP